MGRGWALVGATRMGARQLAVAFVATVLAERGAEAREIVSCYYPNSDCEGEEDEYGVSCTHTEANQCPTPGTGAMELGECTPVTGGGSRKITCPGPVWPWLAAVLFLMLVIGAIVHYWKRVEAGARLEAYMDGLPWYHNAKPHIHSAEIKVVDAGNWLAEHAVAAEHAIAKKYHESRGAKLAGTSAAAGPESVPEPEPEVQPLAARPLPPPPGLEAPAPAPVEAPSEEGVPPSA